MNNNNKYVPIIDLTNKKKPWDKGFESHEHQQKAEFQRAKGDSGDGVDNKEEAE